MYPSGTTGVLGTTVGVITSVGSVIIGEVTGVLTYGLWLCVGLLRSSKSTSPCICHVPLSWPCTLSTLVGSIFAADINA